MAKNTRKSQLIDELASARGELTTHSRGVRRELDVAARLKSSFQRHGFLWMAGAGALALLFTLRPGRRKAASSGWQKPEPKTKAVRLGLLLTGFKVAYFLIRPALAKWIERQVEDYSDSHRKTRGRS